MSVIDFPPDDGKQQAVLLALQNGQHLTTQICYRHFGTTELRKVVCRLRDKGYDIRSYRNDGENYKHYFLQNADKLTADPS